MKKKTKFILLGLIILLAVGYAVLSQTIGISLKNLIPKTEFNVYFDNFEVEEESVEGTYNYEGGTEVSINANFTKPGQKYILDFEIVNDSSMPIKLNSKDIQGITPYTDVGIYFINGGSFYEETAIIPKTRKKVQVVVEMPLEASRLEGYQGTDNFNIDLEFIATTYADGDYSGYRFFYGSGIAPELGEELWACGNRFIVLDMKKDEYMDLMITGNARTSTDEETGEDFYDFYVASAEKYQYDEEKINNIFRSVIGRLEIQGLTIIDYGLPKVELTEQINKYYRYSTDQEGMNFWMQGGNKVYEMDLREVKDIVTDENGVTLYLRVPYQSYTHEEW